MEKLEKDMANVVEESGAVKEQSPLTENLSRARKLMSICAALALSFGAEAKAEVKGEITNPKEKALAAEKAGLPKLEGFEIGHVVMPDNPSSILVFIPQDHLNHPGTKNFRDMSQIDALDSLEYVSNYQRKIHEGLVVLNKEAGIKEVWREGLTPDDEKEHNESMKKDRNIFYASVLGPHIDKIFKTGKNVPINFIKKYQYAAGGLEKLCADGLITIRGAEDAETYRNAFSLADKSSKPNLTKQEKEEINLGMFELRENAALSIIGKKPTNGLKVMVYGGGHDFRNNIAGYNEKFQLNQMGLITLKPIIKKS